MTSAMQMVAERETPTRQCTNVAFPSCLPFAVSGWVSSGTREFCG